MNATEGVSLRRWILNLPPVEYLLQHVRDLLIGSLRCGPIPQHIAFVMDGNRRWARNHKVETVEGHNMGFEALARVLEVCYKSGVKYVTIYAFSIENFKRSKYEVDGLMDMAKTRLAQLCQHGALFERYGTAVRVLGDRSLVREDVLEQVDQAVEVTKHNDRAVLNICFSYTGREEIAHSIRETVREYSTPLASARAKEKRAFSESHIQRNIRTQQLSSVEEEDVEPLQQHQHQNASTPTKEDATTITSDAESTELSEHDLDNSSLLQPASSQTSNSASPVLKPTTTSSTTSTTANNPTRHRRSNLSSSGPLPDPEAITTSTLTKNTYIDAPIPELLIRTSGVNRLSDFMLWQCHESTEIKFLECMWPEFDLWHFLPVLVEWQWRQKQKAKVSRLDGGGMGRGDEVKGS